MSQESPQEVRARQERLRRFSRDLLRAANVVDEKPVRWQERIQEGGKHQLVFEQLLDVCATIRLRKAQAYGESRYEVESPQFDLAMAYSDIHRKVLRLKEQVFSPDPTGSVVEDIPETAADLVNYAGMMLQLAFYLELAKEEVA